MKTSIKKYYTSGVSITNHPEEKEMQLRVTYNRKTTRLPSRNDHTSSFVGDFNIVLFKAGEEKKQDRNFEISYTITAAFDCDDPDVDDATAEKTASALVYPRLAEGIAGVTKATWLGEIELPPYDTFNIKPGE